MDQLSALKKKIKCSYIHSVQDRGEWKGMIVNADRHDT